MEALYYRYKGGVLMKIKEVEERLGITSKNIRFYEEAGLIKVNRNQANGYREFDEKTIEQLQEIKLLRTLGCTLDQIRHYRKQEITLSKLMEERLQQVSEETQSLKQIKQACERLKNTNTPLHPELLEEFQREVKQQRTVKKANPMNRHRLRIRVNLYGVMGGILLCVLFMSMSVEILKLCAMQGWISEQVAINWDGDPFNILISLIIGVVSAIFLSLCTSLTRQQYFLLEQERIYYIDEDSKTSKRKLIWALLSGKIEGVFDMIPYDELVSLEPGLRVNGSYGPSASKSFALVFRITTIHDESIICATGRFGEDQAGIDVLINTLKHQSKKIIDPYHILDALRLNRDESYDRLNDIYVQRKHRNVKQHRHDALWDFS